MNGIRRARRADIQAMAEIVYGWEVTTHWMPGGSSVGAIAKVIDQAFDTREIYVVGEPVDGYFSLNPNEAKIGALYMTRRGQGIGKAMIDLAKDGRDFLWLQTHQPNLEAHRFYRREGFLITGELPPDGAGGPPQYRMEWRG